MNIFRISTFWVPYHDIKIEWQNPEIPALKEWTIKAFDGNLLQEAIGGGATLALVCAFLLWLTDAEWWGWAIITLVMWATLMNTFLQKRVYVTRLTEQGGEVYRWRAIPNFIFASMPWLIVIYAGLVLWGFTVSPEVGLAALAGGGGVGVLYATVFTSDNYKKDQLNLMHWTFSWGDIYEAIYDKESHAIGYNVIESRPYISQLKEKNENFYGGRIYFPPQIADEILQLFTEKLSPTVPIKEGRIYYVS
ncbi:MAG: hypothetical protein ACK4TD_15905 [Ectopseudomonas guguanensis]|uniref:hypothetical protein n=1 Tax=Ectopseudomonas guguanensis TaxID=1198456 RepID=UPI00391C9F67